VYKLLFFASGSGSNFQSVIKAINAGMLDATINGLITDRGDAGAIQRANNRSIPVDTILPEPEQTFADRLLNAINKFNPDLIVLAGYLRKIPNEVIDQYRGKIINIHPSLLPKYGGKGFFGLNVHRAVIENGEHVSGCTVHYVNEIYDSGAIITQKRVKVSENDTPKTLARKILKEEHKLLPKTIKQLITN